MVNETAPTRAAGASRDVTASVRPAPMAQVAPWVSIHAAPPPSGYGCGIWSVVSAISHSPARRSTSDPSERVKGRRTSRAVVSVGMSPAIVPQSDLTLAEIFSLSFERPDCPSPRVPGSPPHTADCGPHGLLEEHCKRHVRPEARVGRAPRARVLRLAVGDVRSPKAAPPSRGL